MTYIWRGRKPHRRAFPRDTEGHRGFRTVEVKPGEAFEPSEAELTSFKDLLEPVGVGLQVASAPVSHAARLNPSVFSLVSRAHSGEATNDEQAIVGDVIAFLDAQAHGSDTPAMRADLADALSEFGLPLFVEG